MVSESSFPRTFNLLGGNLPKGHPLLQPGYNLERRHHFEELASNVLEHFATDRARARLVSKLRNPPQFEAAISEVVTWSYFYNRSFRVDVEPFGDKGPDFRVSRDGLTAIVEVCSLGQEASELRLLTIFKDISKRTKDLRSRYLIDICIQEEMCRETGFLSRAVRAARRALFTVEDSALNSAIFYYFGSDDHLLLNDPVRMDDFCTSDLACHGRTSEEISGCAFVARFRKTSTTPKNLITISAKDGAFWSSSVARLKSTLHEKRGRQLRRSDRNIIVVDPTYCAGLDSIDIFDALYGRAYVSVDSETLSECGHGRRRDGFFHHTERIQAIALIRNSVPRDASAWAIFPTHNHRTSGRFTRTEFEMLGGLQPELAHLAR
jgi:hypothetical protein